MDAVRYYNEHFGRDIVRVAGGCGQRISIVALSPSPPDCPLLDGSAREFATLEHKTRFLLCLYFTILLDQAVHSSRPEEHGHFDDLARYPKLGGILGSYHMNMHPALLLLAATLYTDPESEPEATADLQALARHFPQEYWRFFRDEYPRLTGRLDTKDELLLAMKRFFRELSNATALLWLPRSLGRFSSKLRGE